MVLGQEKKSTVTRAIAAAFTALALSAAPSLTLAQTPPTQKANAPSNQQTNAEFYAWLDGFRAEALSAGVRANVIDAAFASVTLNRRVFELNDNQPEFSRNIWDYLDSAISETRLSNGKAKYAAHSALLQQMEAQYGVDPAIIIAIWGLETSYGAIMGDHDAISALATLAWKGRRTGYGRSQLIGALKIIQNNFASRADLKGSWAGAMGHTQFIPTTYLSYAVDYDGDGRRDIWTNLGDVFASTANYLRVSKFQKGERWGAEVTLPATFDYGEANIMKRRAVAEWTGLGVATPNGSLVTAFDPNLRGRIILPAGARGPAFIVFENFEAILKYNRSTAYALAVSLLSDRIAGRGGVVQAPWPRDDRALSLTERKKLQQALRDKGFNPGPIDGVVGAGTKNALRAWQKTEGLPADGYASADILLKLTAPSE